MPAQKLNCYNIYESRHQAVEIGNFVLALADARMKEALHRAESDNLLKAALDHVPAEHPLRARISTHLDL